MTFRRDHLPPPDAADDRVRTTEDVAVLRPSGDVDAASAGRLRRDLEAAVATGRPLVLVDMSAVTFLDSAGLAAIVGVRRELPPGQRMALAAVPARMRRVLQVAALDALMVVHCSGEPWPWPQLPDLASQPPSSGV